MKKRAFVAVAVSTLPGLAGCASSTDDPRPEPLETKPAGDTSSTGSEEVSPSINQSLKDGDEVKPMDDCGEWCFDGSLGIYYCCGYMGRPLMVEGSARVAEIETRDDWAG